VKDSAWKQFCRLAILPSLLAPLCAWAHTTGISYADIEIHERHIDVRLRLNLRELQFARELDRNADLLVTREEVQLGFPGYLSSILEHVRMETAGVMGQGRLKEIDFLPERGEIECWLDFSFRQRLDAAVSMTVALHYLTDSGHWTLAQVRYDGRQEQRYFNLENPATQIVLFRSTASYLRLGWRYFNAALRRVTASVDLVLFVAGLVFIGTSWRGFCLPAMSLFLAQLATFALGISAGPVLPTRFVSSSLALSVIYVAAENLFIKEVSHRSWVAVFFGLIYGLGFSNLIQDMGLPEEGRVTALLGYQAGVGLSIACTVAVVYATVAWVGRLQRQRQAMALTSLCFMAFGIFEFVQRTF